jgi:membrane protein
MPALRDATTVIRRIGFFHFWKNIWHEIGDDNLFTWASALAYSWLFAIFPFFLVLLSLIPLLKFDWRVTAKDQINAAINQLPREANVTIRQFIEPRLNNLLFEHDRSSITSILSIGLLVTIWAASSGVAMTMSAMDRAYDVERARPFYKQRPLAVLLTIIVASMIISVVILIPIGTIVTNYLTSGTEKLLEATHISKPASTAESPKQAAATTMPATRPDLAVGRQLVQKPHRFELWIILWQIARYGLSLLLLFWVVALMYHFGPNVKQRFRVITPGSLFTVGVWILLAGVFRFYVDRFGKFGQTYGAVGGVIILLFFFYMDALVLLIGAEINSEIDAFFRKQHHEPDKPPPPSETQDTQPAVETP